MDKLEALETLAALSQQTRLDTFRLLVKHEPEGLPAGEIARALDVPPNTLSTHLATLARANLVVPERRSRVIQYRADISRLRGLLVFLAKDCCGGRAELCEPLFDELRC
ncbi:metalloregulator ArsR/SmtB family transcription factor [Tsuneonella sp. CC-YZS046]|uniref:ArsR/SmtB family transcription factor n=1 Tax=Tsuneonella sp. CC-YZS046 TaxID=3042152 RepID=UPI002D79928A|nr:metalloregulator ArsR/SmtB family transcription factor [Tsuneonella sp. CC-YZS046]WRO66793.1 metalloregulator ArsR/SmtB family transcription factor [Tsuneonella sp. CC-YZS046]